MNRVNTTTPSERSEKEGLSREPRELSCEELESIIGGVAVEAWVPLVTNTMVISAPQFAQSWGSTSGTSAANSSTVAVQSTTNQGFNLTTNNAIITYYQ